MNSYLDDLALLRSYLIKYLNAKPNDLKPLKRSLKSFVTSFKKKEQHSFSKIIEATIDRSNEKSQSNKQRENKNRDKSPENININQKLQSSAILTLAACEEIEILYRKSLKPPHEMRNQAIKEALSKQSETINEQFILKEYSEVRKKISQIKENYTEVLTDQILKVLDQLNWLYESAGQEIIAEIKNSEVIDHLQQEIYCEIKGPFLGDLLVLQKTCQELLLNQQNKTLVNAHRNSMSNASSTNFSTTTEGQKEGFCIRRVGIEYIHSFQRYTITYIINRILLNNHILPAFVFSLKDQGNTASSSSGQSSSSQMTQQTDKKRQLFYLLSLSAYTKELEDKDSFQPIEQFFCSEKDNSKQDLNEKQQTICQNQQTTQLNLESFTKHIFGAMLSLPLDCFIPTYWMNQKGQLLRHLCCTGNEDKMEHAGIKNPLFYFRNHLTQSIYQSQFFQYIFNGENITVQKESQSCIDMNYTQLLLQAFYIISEGAKTDFKFLEPKKGIKINSLILTKEQISVLMQVTKEFQDTFIWLRESVFPISKMQQCTISQIMARVWPILYEFSGRILSSSLKQHIDFVKRISMEEFLIKSQIIRNLINSLTAAGNTSSSTPSKLLKEKEKDKCNQVNSVAVEWQTQPSQGLYIWLRLLDLSQVNNEQSRYSIMKWTANNLPLLFNNLHFSLLSYSSFGSNVVMASVQAQDESWHTNWKKQESWQDLFSYQAQCNEEKQCQIFCEFLCLMFGVDLVSTNNAQKNLFSSMQYLEENPHNLHIFNLYLSCQCFVNNYHILGNLLERSLQFHKYQLTLALLAKGAGQQNLNEVAIIYFFNEAKTQINDIESQQLRDKVEKQLNSLLQKKHPHLLNFFKWERFWRVSLVSNIVEQQEESNKKERYYKQQNQEQSKIDQNIQSKNQQKSIVDELKIQQETDSINENIQNNQQSELSQSNKIEENQNDQNQDSTLKDKTIINPVESQTQSENNEDNSEKRIDQSITGQNITSFDLPNSNLASQYLRINVLEYGVKYMSQAIWSKLFEVINFGQKQKTTLKLKNIMQNNDEKNIFVVNQQQKLEEEEVVLQNKNHLEPKLQKQQLQISKLDTDLDQYFYFIRINDTNDCFYGNIMAAEALINLFNRSIRPKNTIVQINQCYFIVFQDLRNTGINNYKCISLQQAAIEGSLDKQFKLDRQFFCERVLLTLLTYPQNDTLLDEVLERHPYIANEYRLINISMSRWFVEGIEKDDSNDQSFIKMKSVLLCMDQMHEQIDHQTFDKFRQLDPFTLLKQWLLNLESWQCHNSSLSNYELNEDFLIMEEDFDVKLNEERDNIANKKDDPQVQHHGQSSQDLKGVLARLCQISFQNKAIIKLYQRFARLVKYLRKWDIQNSNPDQIQSQVVGGNVGNQASSSNGNSSIGKTVSPNNSGAPNNSGMATSCQKNLPTLQQIFDFVDPELAQFYARVNTLKTASLQRRFDILKSNLLELTCYSILPQSIVSFESNFSFFNFSHYCLKFIEDVKSYHTVGPLASLHKLNEFGGFFPFSDYTQDFNNLLQQLIKAKLQTQQQLRFFLNNVDLYQLEKSQQATFVTTLLTQSQLNTNDAFFLKDLILRGCFSIKIAHLLQNNNGLALERIKRLCLPGNQRIYDADVLTIAEKCPCLTHFDLSQNGLIEKINANSTCKASSSKPIRFRTLRTLILVDLPRLQILDVECTSLQYVKLDHCFNLSTCFIDSKILQSISIRTCNSLCEHVVAIWIIKGVNTLVDEFTSHEAYRSMITSNNYFKNNQINSAPVISSNSRQGFAHNKRFSTNISQMKKLFKIQAYKGLILNIFAKTFSKIKLLNDSLLNKFAYALTKVQSDLITLQNLISGSTTGNIGSSGNQLSGSISSQQTSNMQSNVVEATIRTSDEEEDNIPPQQGISQQGVSSGVSSQPNQPQQQVQQGQQLQTTQQQAQNQCAQQQSPLTTSSTTTVQQQQPQQSFFDNIFSSGSSVSNSGRDSQGNSTNQNEQLVKQCRIALWKVLLLNPLVRELKFSFILEEIGEKYLGSLLKSMGDALHSLNSHFSLKHQRNFVNIKEIDLSGLSLQQRLTEQQLANLSVILKNLPSQNQSSYNNQKQVQNRHPNKVKIHKGIALQLPNVLDPSTSLKDLFESIEVKNKNAIRRLDISKNRLDDDRVLLLSSFLRRVEGSCLSQLILKNCRLTDEHIKILCNEVFIKSKQPVKCIDFSDNCFGAKSLQLFIQALLSTQRSNAGSKTQQGMAENSIKQQTSSMPQQLEKVKYTTHLYLDGNDLRGSEFKSLADAVFLKKLLLVQTMIGDAELIHLSLLLGNPYCQLRSLDLSFNKLEEQGILNLSESLKGNSSLLHLKLVKSLLPQSQRLMGILCQGLQYNQNLILLDISANQIGDEGIQQLGSIVAVNQKLLTIKIAEDNTFSASGLNNFLDSLRNNFTLQDLHIDSISLQEGTSSDSLAVTSQNTNESDEPNQIIKNKKLCIAQIKEILERNISASQLKQQQQIIQQNAEKLESVFNFGQFKSFIVPEDNYMKQQNQQQSTFQNQEEDSLMMMNSSYSAAVNQQQQDEISDISEKTLKPSITEQPSDHQLQKNDKSSQQVWKLGLSIDGGGMRGVIPATLISILCSETRREVHEIFDVVGGTSIGGIIALGLTGTLDGRTTIASSDSIVNFFDDYGTTIFNASKIVAFWNNLRDKAKYDPVGIESVLYRCFQNCKLSDVIAGTSVICTAVKRELVQGRSSAKIFRSKQAFFKGDDHNFFMRDVARATSAAPTYFPSAEIYNVKGTKKYSLIDGAIGQNNPSKLVLDDIKTEALNSGSEKKFFLVSLSTGTLITKNQLGQTAGVFNLMPILESLNDSASDYIDKDIEKNSLGQYIRVKPKIPIEKGKADLDNTNQQIVELYKQSAEEEAYKVFTNENRFGVYSDQSLVEWLAENTAQKKDFYI